MRQSKSSTVQNMKLVNVTSSNQIVPIKLLALLLEYIISVPIYDTQHKLPNIHPIQHTGYNFTPFVFTF